MIPPFCTACALSSPQGATFCVYCGQALAATGPTQRLTSSQESTDNRPAYIMGTGGSIGVIPVQATLGWGPHGSYAVTPFGTIGNPIPRLICIDNQWYEVRV